MENELPMNRPARVPDYMRDGSMVYQLPEVTDLPFQGCQDSDGSVPHGTPNPSGAIGSAPGE